MKVVTIDATDEASHREVEVRMDSSLAKNMSEQKDTGLNTRTVSRGRSRWCGCTQRVGESRTVSAKAGAKVNITKIKVVRAHLGYLG